MRASLTSGVSVSVSGVKHAASRANASPWAGLLVINSLLHFIYYYVTVIWLLLSYHTGVSVAIINIVNIVVIM